MHYKSIWYFQITLKFLHFNSKGSFLWPNLRSIDITGYCSDHFNTFQESNDGEESWQGEEQGAAGSSTRRAGWPPAAGQGQGEVEGGAHGKLVRKKKKILVVPSYNDKLGIGFFLVSSSSAATLYSQGMSVPTLFRS